MISLKIKLKICTYIRIAYIASPPFTLCVFPVLCEFSKGFIYMNFITTIEFHLGKFCYIFTKWFYTTDKIGLAWIFPGPPKKVQITKGITVFETRILLELNSYSNTYILKCTTTTLKNIYTPDPSNNSQVSTRKGWLYHYQFRLLHAHCTDGGG